MGIYSYNVKLEQFRFINLSINPTKGGRLSHIQNEASHVAGKNAKIFSKFWGKMMIYHGRSGQKNHQLNKQKDGVWRPSSWDSSP